jgi:hypothetical protein
MMAKGYGGTLVASSALTNRLADTLVENSVNLRSYRLVRSNDYPPRFFCYFQTMSRHYLFDLSFGIAVAALAAWFLPHEPFPAGVVALLAGAAGLLWRRPCIALFLAVLADIVADVAYGVLLPPENEWNLVMAIVVAASLGTFAPPLLAYGGVGALAASVALQMDSEALANWLWATAVLSCVTTLAALMARSGRRARSAWTRVEQLAAMAPEMVARSAVARERVRLTADIHDVVRASVLPMRGHADIAAAAWQAVPAPSLRAIQERGRQAISELRWLLGFLRDEQDKPEEVRAAPADPHRLLGYHLWVDVIGALGVVLLAAAEYFAWGEFPPSAAAEPSLVATVLAAATFGLRGTSPGISALLCGAVFLISALIERPVAPGIWCFAVVGALSWTALYRARPVGIAGVVVMLGCQIVFALLVDQDLLIFIVVAASVAGFLDTSWCGTPPGIPRASPPSAPSRPSAPCGPKGLPWPASCTT